MKELGLEIVCSATGMIGELVPSCAVGDKGRGCVKFYSQLHMEVYLAEVTWQSLAPVIHTTVQGRIASTVNGEPGHSGVIVPHAREKNTVNERWISSRMNVVTSAILVCLRRQQAALAYAQLRCTAAGLSGQIWEVVLPLVALL